MLLEVLPDMPEVVRVSFLDGTGTARRINYHFEFGRQGERGYLTGRNPQALACAIRVVTLLGGRVFDEATQSDLFEQASPMPPAG